MTSTDPRTTRRTFLKTATAGIAAASAMQPFFVRASDKTGNKTAVVGEGDYQYTCEHGWGELPESIRWGATHGVTIDANGMIYIKHQSPEEQVMDAIVVFDPEGKYVRSFGKEYHGGGHGIDIRTEGANSSCISPMSKIWK
ncbi:MAG: twin-arginine translocation signal domain-containing protein [Planctomycetaceae bacterium]